MGETEGDREGPFPPGPMTRGELYITKMGPFYFSWTVFQQLQ